MNDKPLETSLDKALHSCVPKKRKESTQETSFSSEVHNAYTEQQRTDMAKVQAIADRMSARRLGIRL